MLNGGTWGCKTGQEVCQGLLTLNFLLLYLSLKTNVSLLYVDLLGLLQFGNSVEITGTNESKAT